MDVNSAYLFRIQNLFFNTNKNFHVFCTDITLQKLKWYIFKLENIIPIDFL